MGRRQKQKIDLGNAISLEDALSIMVVTFVLFIIFLVPLVTVEKDKLEKAQTDDYWQSLSTWITEKATETPDIESYSMAFELDNAKVTKSERGEYIFIEAFFDDGAISIIRHHKISKSYIAMYIKANSQVVSYRIGNITWSKDENMWFTYNNSIDYGSNPESVTMQKEFREYTKSNRGF